MLANSVRYSLFFLLPSCTKKQEDDETEKAGSLLEKTKKQLLADWSSYPWDILSQQQANIYFPNGTYSSFIKVTPQCPASAQRPGANTSLWVSERWQNRAETKNSNMTIRAPIPLFEGIFWVLLQKAACSRGRCNNPSPIRGLYGCSTILSSELWCHLDGKSSFGICRRCGVDGKQQNILI